MGKNQVHCGPAGSGGTIAQRHIVALGYEGLLVPPLFFSESVKLCNNLALAVQMIGTSEALALVDVALEVSLRSALITSHVLFRARALESTQKF